MMEDKSVLLVASFVVLGIFVSLTLASGFMQIVSPGHSVNFTDYNITYNSSQIFINVSFFNNHSAFGESSLAFNNMTTVAAQTAINMTILFGSNQTGSWSYTINYSNTVNCSTWGGSVLNKSACWVNITVNSSTGIGDGSYRINVTLDNGSMNLSIGNVQNMTYNITLENHPPQVELANVTILRTGGAVASAASGRNYSANFVVNVTIVNPGMGVNYVLLNVSNGTVRTALANATQLSREGQTDRYSATISPSSYVDGFYNLTVIANGSGFNLSRNDSTILTMVYLDTTIPYGTVTCTPSTVSAGDTVTCACSGADAGTNANSTSITANPSTSNTGTYTSYCTVVDSAGNPNTISGTYTVELSTSSSSSSSSSGSSSSGGGGVVATTSITKEHTFTRIDPGTPGIATGYEISYGINEISIDVLEASQDVGISVTRYDGRPSVVAEKDESVYSYLKIDATNVEDTLDKAMIKIQVQKSWVTEEGLEKDEVVLSSYSGGTWSDLTTTYSEEDDNYYYYVAETTEFGYVAIAGKMSEVVETPTEEEAGLSTMWWIIIIVVAILVIVGIVIPLMKKK